MNREKNIWSSLAIFLIPALCTVTRSGHMYGCGILAAVSLLDIKTWRHKRVMPKHGWLLFASFMYIALVWFMDDWVSGRGSRSFEYPVRILLLLSCMWYMLIRKPQAEWLWAGIVVGTVAAFFYGSYQFFVLNTRAFGAISIIHFGNFSMLFACMALCAWNWPMKNKKLWRFGLIAIFIMGMLASIFSGTRGSWLALPLLVAAYFIYLIFTKRIRTKHLFSGLAACCVVVVILYSTPQLRIGERVRTAYDEVLLYKKEGAAYTSVGSRLQMWEFAWDLYKKKPIFGWTYKGYVAEQETAILNKKMDSMMHGFQHPHQELLNAAAKTGTFGLIAILQIYIIPFFVFMHRFKNNINCSKSRSVCSAGMLMPIAFFGFGLADSIIAHTTPFTLYCYMLAMLWAASLAFDNSSRAQ